MLTRTHEPPAPPMDPTRMGAALRATLRLLIMTPADKVPPKGAISARGQVRYKVLDDLVSAGLASRKAKKDRDGSDVVQYLPTPQGKSIARRLFGRHGDRAKRVAPKRRVAKSQHRKHG